MSGLTAALTRSVTSSMLIRTFSSRSTHLSSSALRLGVEAVSMKSLFAGR